MISTFKLATMLHALLIMFMLVIAGSAQAEKIAGVSLDESVLVNDIEFTLNGAGVRKKLFFKLYVGSLYVNEALKGANAQTLVEADEPMLIQLNILSDLLTRDKLIKALNDGFKKSTGGNTAPVQDQIDLMADALNEPVVPGDIYQLVYLPQTGTSLVRGDKTLATMTGLPFKQAAFGIWLSDSPVQKSLKQAMLAL